MLYLKRKKKEMKDCRVLSSSEFFKEWSINNPIQLHTKLVSLKKRNSCTRQPY